MTNHAVRLGKRLGAVVAAAAVALSVAQLPTLALADTRPPDPSNPTTPVTASVDPLPTVQIDGVAWTQLVVGNTVYVGGRFTSSRPAGAAAGTQTTPRSNLLAYDITTGDVINTWNVTTNSDVLALAASPDKSKIYIGGSFTQVNGQTKNRIAAVSASTGALVPGWASSPDTTVRAIVATDSTVYYGGLFTSISGTPRNRAAAVNATNGALLSWAPNVQGGVVRAMAMSPDGNQILLGGAFTSVNGSSNPGYGLGSVDSNTGGSLPWAANGLIRNGGANAAITSLTADGDSVYASGYVFGSGGNLEGIARMNWNGGTTTWVEDCHGDTYQSFPVGDLVYGVSHSHYCGNLPDGYPQTNPWTYHWGLAFSKAVAGTLKADPLGYFNWRGTPSPNLQKWFPELINGSFTGQGQAGWAVTGNSKYVAIGGEFPTVAGATQQGLVRFATPDIAPNKVGPEFSGAHFNPTLTTPAGGTVKINWTANWDRDNELLTYSVIRDGIIASPIYKVSQKSSEWSRPAMGFLDTNLVPGQTYRYRVFATDPWGNEARSDTISVVATDAAPLSPYAQDVLNDNPVTYWRLGDNPGSTTAADLAGSNNGVVRSGVAFGAAGAVSGDTAAGVNGTTNGLISTTAAQDGPSTFSTEAWIKTTSTRGGKIIGFGSSQSGSSSSYDRHVYMRNTGQLIFGVYPGSVQTIATTKAYNDGAWHHVVATLGSGGMTLFVDGQQAVNRTDVTSAQSYLGYWRVGGDNLGSWPNQPASNYINGTVDDVAIYSTALSAAQVADHYRKAGGQLPNEAPTADFSTTVNKATVTFDGTTSSDVDGTIASYAWDFGDGATSTLDKPSHTFGTPGDHSVKLTVTDDDGATGTVTKTVTTSDNVSPVAAFSFTVNEQIVNFDSSGSSDSDGTVDSYAWDFGDGGTSTAANPSHTFGSTGDQSVTLTVTDNDGATGTITKTVTTVAPTGPLATDAFSRSTTGGWGTADKGGAWTKYGNASLFSVVNGAGQIQLATAGSGPRVALESVSSTDTDVSVKAVLDKVAGGGGSFVMVGARTIGTNDYRAKVKISSTGATTLYLVKVVNNVETQLSSVNLGAATNYAAGDTLNVRVQAFGTSPTTIQAKAWKSTQTEPANWQLSTTDSEAVLQAPGGVGVVGYLSGSATGMPVLVRFDDLSAVSTK